MQVDSNGKGICWPHLIRNEKTNTCSVKNRELPNCVFPDGGGDICKLCAPGYYVIAEVPTLTEKVFGDAAFNKSRVNQNGQCRRGDWSTTCNQACPYCVSQSKCGVKKPKWDPKCEWRLRSGTACFMCKKGFALSQSQEKEYHDPYEQSSATGSVCIKLHHKGDPSDVASTQDVVKNPPTSSFSAPIFNGFSKTFGKVKKFAMTPRVMNSGQIYGHEVDGKGLDGCFKAKWAHYNAWECIKCRPDYEAVKVTTGTKWYGDFECKLPKQKANPNYEKCMRNSKRTFAQQKCFQAIWEWAFKDRPEEIQKWENMKFNTDYTISESEL
jgi:hypothetical protein